MHHTHELSEKLKHDKRREKCQGLEDALRDLDLTAKVVYALMISGKTFDSLNDSKQGVGKIYKLQQAMGLLPPIKEKPKKSDEEAQQLRVEGNQAYKDKDLMEALRLYTEAICCAELEGEEIAMGYANRSAVTFALEEYQNSIEDINRALSTGKYPRNLTRKLFERRAKCFLALSQYQRASADFKQVIIYLLETDIDAEKVTSLKACIDAIADCLGKQDSPTKTGVPPPKLSHGPSSYIESASAAVDIRYSLEMGRHIVATQDIAPGDILAIEKPFASVLYRKCHHIYCNNCKKRSHSSIPCVSCNEVVYCSEICRDTSWATYHSVECDFIHHLNNLGCKDNAMLAVRTLMKTTQLGKNLQMFMDEFLSESEVPCKPEKAGFVDNKYLSDHYKPIHNLLTNKEHRSQEYQLNVAALASSLIHILKETTKFFEHTDSFVPSAALFKPVSALRWNHIVAADLIMRYMMMADGSAQKTKETRWKRMGDALSNHEEAIGEAIYSFASLMNHSCDPDVGVCRYNGDTLIVYALKSITKGQQIFASYSYYAQEDKHVRQNKLRSKFFFTCKCTACMEDWPRIENMTEGKPKFLSARSEKRYKSAIAELGEDVRKIFLAEVKGNMTEEHFRLAVQHLILIDRYVKKPWKVQYYLQSSIHHFIRFTLSPNLIKITTING